MSTFDGRVREYPTIAIDNYQPTRPNVRIFLLSHAHADHLSGLKSTSFNIPLYCSEDTARLLMHLPQRVKRRRGDDNVINGSGGGDSNTIAAAAAAPRFSHLRKYIRALPYEEPTQIYVGDGITITLTLFPANHCIGSTMFLIEGHAPKPNILYTGDLRAESWFTHGIQSYILNRTLPADIKTVYLDTTFCHEDFAAFPTKAESIENVLCIIRKYNATTRFRLGYTIFGVEPLWERVAKEFGCKIYLSPPRFALYSRLTSPPDYITSDPHATRFHACEWCPVCFDKQNRAMTVNIWPSTMRWRGELRAAGRGTKHYPSDDNDDHEAAAVVQSAERTWYVLYSIHSSLLELQDLVSVLRPQSVYPCVLSKERFESKRVQNLFRPFLRPVGGAREAWEGEVTKVEVKKVEGVVVDLAESSQDTLLIEGSDPSLPVSETHLASGVVVVQEEQQQQGISEPQTEEHHYSNEPNHNVDDDGDDDDATNTPSSQLSHQLLDPATDANSPAHPPDHDPYPDIFPDDRDSQPASQGSLQISFSLQLYETEWEVDDDGDDDDMGYAKSNGATIIARSLKDGCCDRQAGHQDTHSPNADITSTPMMPLIHSSPTSAFALWSNPPPTATTTPWQTCDSNSEPPPASQSSRQHQHQHQPPPPPRLTHAPTQPCTTIQIFSQSSDDCTPLLFAVKDDTAEIIESVACIDSDGIGSGGCSRDHERVTTATVEGMDMSGPRVGVASRMPGQGIGNSVGAGLKRSATTTSSWIPQRPRRRRTQPPPQQDHHPSQQARPRALARSVTAPSATSRATLTEVVRPAVGECEVVDLTCD
ncbi:beta-lactamase-like protein [Powellomyces hirtus]|nr:beta-lactamase-like protein [Powellomyces hirtus]